MGTNTVKVSNLSPKVAKRDIEDFFSFSGEITHIELQSEGDLSQVAYVTFKEPQALDTAIHLSGATIVDQSVNITAAEDYHPSSAPRELTGSENAVDGAAAAGSAQDVITSMLSKGFILGKDAMSKARSFDEKHHFTANTAATVSSLDKKIGLSQKFSAGTSAVNERMKAVDEKFQLSERTKSAIAAAEQKVSSAGSALLKNKYLFSSAAWVMGAFSKVTKAAGDVGQKTLEKVQLSETQKQSGSYESDHSKDDIADSFGRISVSESFDTPPNLGKHANPPSYDS